MPTISEKLRNPNFARSPTFAAAYMREAADVIDKLAAVVEAGLSLVSDDKGWGTYRRMDSPDLYVEASEFADNARAALSLVRQEEKG